ncbi:hypothetical protein C0992_006286 [Termitomyces sp. T32_za158]|nr:hypothetical protein C0992_006286 [Termitomyces sp. T32_za158]
MSSFSLLDNLQLAVGHVGIDPEAITWSSISSVAAFTLVSVFVLFRASYRPSELVSLKKSKAPAKTITRAMQRIRDAVMPEDGSVTVAEILIHPIKAKLPWNIRPVLQIHPPRPRGSSVAPQPLSQLTSADSLQNDREWCFVDVEKNAIITAREFPKIVLITPRIEKDPADAHGGSILVAFPPDAPEGCTDFRIPLHPSPELLKSWDILDSIGLFSDTLDGYIGHTLPLSAPSRASAISSLYFNKPVHLVYKGPRPRRAEETPLCPSLDAATVFQDGYPLLMMSRESMGELEDEVRSRVAEEGMGVGEEWREARVEIRRFRPNIVVQGAGPFAEDAWAEVGLGSREAPVVKLFPNISPETGERDKAVPYKVLMKFRTGLDSSTKLSPCVGCNGVFTGTGVVNVGDIVYVNKLIPPSEALPK